MDDFHSCSGGLEELLMLLCRSRWSKGRTALTSQQGFPLNLCVKDLVVGGQQHHGNTASLRCLHRGQEGGVTTAGLELRDHAEGSCGGGGGTPVREVAVLAPFQEVLAPLVVGPLVEDPGAIRYHGGVDFPELEGLVNRRTILGALRRLAFETLPLITFYEEKNFQGRSYECINDCSDMSSYLSRCQSCRVESGCFMVYDRTNYMGNQYYMKRGDYSDYMSFGMSDSIRSCRLIPQHKGQFRMNIYEKESFGGQSHEMMDDCDNVMDRYCMNDCQSCNITFYEEKNFQGRSYECMNDCSDMSSYLSRRRSTTPDIDRPSGLVLLQSEPLERRLQSEDQEAQTQ
ncbi:Gamma-crystallin M3 [Liparis tanakae]|uniref:Gamma-crystallin M3 n=1 Tax=Liparis tanakae TaxID=230148 RepID=A0A4Z2FP57_9TELE|nr:Gamma-crystallin M3 [Liparis tanakae]